MKLTKRAKALYIHCLPADITALSCENGEVSAEVFKKNRLMTYLQASFKPYIIEAMIIVSIFSEPASLMNYLYQQSGKSKKRVTALERWQDK